MKLKNLLFLLIFVICFFSVESFSQISNEQKFINCVNEQFGNTQGNIFPKYDEISIFGMVSNPMKVTANGGFLRKIKESNNLLPMMKLTEAIKIVGGIINGADERVFINRSSLKSEDRLIVVNLKKIQNGEIPDVDLFLKDIVIIPEICERFHQSRKCVDNNINNLTQKRKPLFKNQIRIVEHTGSEIILDDFEKQTTVLEVLSRLGEFEESRYFMIIRPENKGKRIDLTLDEVMKNTSPNVKLQGKDTIVKWRDCSVDNYDLPVKNP